MLQLVRDMSRFTSKAIALVALPALALLASCSVSAPNYADIIGFYRSTNAPGQSLELAAISDSARAQLVSVSYVLGPNQHERLNRSGLAVFFSTEAGSSVVSHRYFLYRPPPEDGYDVSYDQSESSLNFWDLNAVVILRTSLLYYLAKFDCEGNVVLFDARSNTTFVKVTP